MSQNGKYLDRKHEMQGERSKSEKIQKDLEEFFIEKEEGNKVFFESWVKEVLEKGEKQIVLELQDYWNMMDVYSKVLDRVTHGKMSKTTYTYEAICEVLDEIEEGDYN